MRLSAAVVYLATTATVASAFAFAPQSRTARAGAPFTVTSLAASSSDLHEFDFLLREQTATSTSSDVEGSHSRRGIALGGNSDGKSVILASSFAAPNQVQEQEQVVGDADSDATLSDDPYANSLDADALQLSKIQNFQEQSQVDAKSDLENRLRNMDLQDIIATIILPSVVAFAAARWGFNKVYGKVKTNVVTTLDSFAKEMVYHDGDFDEMKMAVADYNTRLVWLGPTKKDRMLKKYLEVYAKKKTCSPKSISSLSYAFSLFKLSEEQAAQTLVSLCREMGTDKISSAGKLLFLGSRILKSQEGKAALAPIKELIKSTYREEAVADQMVDISQQ
jgi:hypothetical protein